MRDGSREIRSVAATVAGRAATCSVPGAVARLRDVTAFTKLLTSGKRASRFFSIARSIAATIAGGVSFASAASGGVGA